MPQAPIDNTAMAPVDSQDNEAAGLLMLFSNQSKRLSTTTSITEPPAKVSKPSEHTARPANHGIQMTRRNSSINREHITSNSMLDSMTKSPGPAAAALASENGSNKAIVAAAALAAAAATPIPVFHKSFPENETKTVSKSKTAENALKPGINLKSETVKKESIVVKEEKRGRKEERTPNIPKKKEQVAEKESDLPSYAVGPDSGIISCVCGYDHDDGLTIQCDKCFRWQHLVCMGFKSIDDTPDDFQCNLCNKNLHVDEVKARKLQQKFLNDEKSKKKRDSSDTVKENGKNLNDNGSNNNGFVQFKKKKIDESSNEVVGVHKYKTLYYPIDFFTFKSIPIKSLINQLPDILKKNENKKMKPMIKIDKSNLNKIITNVNNLNIKNSSDNSKTRFSGISKLGLYPLKNIREGSCISLMAGEMDTKVNYMAEKVNKYWILGCPKPSVYFHPDLPISIDQRGMGNFTRFIRKSCEPNCEIRTILLNKNEISFGVFTIKDVRSDTELTLPWEWDVDHPILKLINEEEEEFETISDFDNNAKITLINSILGMADLTDCACSNSSCALNKIKKASSYLQRNTRKNNVSFVSPTPNQKHIPIEQRLNERDHYIMNHIQSTKNDGNFKDNENGTNDIEVEVANNAERSDSNNKNIKEESSSEDISDLNHLVFKPKKKSSLYNIHILPKQLELLKQYNEVANNKVNLTNIIYDEEDETNLPIPVEVNPDILKKLAKSSSTDSKISNEVNQTENEAKTNTDGADEKPKIVKRFSLADYKKKKTG